MTEDQQRQLINRLRRLQGQLGGVERMIEARKPLPATIQQVQAAQSALDQVLRLLVGSSLPENAQGLTILSRDQKEALLRLLSK
jgi:DNA-binding FrmR family transcriptional regulator